MPVTVEFEYVLCVKYGRAIRNGAALNYNIYMYFFIFPQNNIKKGGGRREVGFFRKYFRNQINNMIYFIVI